MIMKLTHYIIVYILLTIFLSILEEILYKKIKYSKTVKQNLINKKHKHLKITY